MISRLAAQDASATSATTSVTANYLSTPTAGNLLIGTLYNSDSYALIVPPAGWVLAAGSNDTSLHSASIWYKRAGSGEPTAIAFNESLSGSMHLNIYEYTSDTGNLGLFSVDQIASANSGANLVNSQTTGQISTSEPKELIFACVIFAGSGSAPSWTSLNARQNTTRNFNADLVVSAIGDYATTLTVTGTAVKMAGCIAGFVESKRSVGGNRLVAESGLSQSEVAN